MIFRVILIINDNNNKYNNKMILNFNNKNKQ